MLYGKQSEDSAALLVAPEATPASVDEASVTLSRHPGHGWFKGVSEQLRNPTDYCAVHPEIHHKSEDREWSNAVARCFNSSCTHPKSQGQKDCLADGSVLGFSHLHKHAPVCSDGGCTLLLDRSLVCPEGTLEQMLSETTDWFTPTVDTGQWLKMLSRVLSHPYEEQSKAAELEVSNASGDKEAIAKFLAGQIIVNQGRVPSSLRYGEWLPVSSLVSLNATRIFLQCKLPGHTF